MIGIVVVWLLSVLVFFVIGFYGDGFYGDVSVVRGIVVNWSNVSIFFVNVEGVY